MPQLADALDNKACRDAGLLKMPIFKEALACSSNPFSQNLP
jgi:hypothetical protein